VPLYDLPKAAPAPLRLLQLFVNTADHENGSEWLPDQAALDVWLEQHELSGPVELRAALELREALRALLRANNGNASSAAAISTVNEAAAALAVGLDEAGLVRISAGDAGLGRIVAVAVTAMLDGTWPRLKVCRNCGWSFYDYSKNRSASWCSMQLCGNRLKTRAYRRRRAVR
jgi:predicted RNA-binding Zn ribbon-like protein